MFQTILSMLLKIYPEASIGIQHTINTQLVLGHRILSSQYWLGIHNGQGDYYFTKNFGSLYEMFNWVNDYCEKRCNIEKAVNLYFSDFEKGTK